MKIWDTIYGQFEIPEFLDAFVMSPEFRRLAEVRLININSPSLAALADVRRYSHTLGALRLALENKLPNLGREEYRAFLATIIIHDAGTPAFAHLFEYFLIDRFNWDHESVLPLLLKGEHHPDADAHQIFESQVPQFRKLCGKAKIDFDIVLEILEGKHPSAKLIFGSVDFDNLDNVARMNWMLGHRFDVSHLLSIARDIGVRSDGQLLLPIAQADNLTGWLDLRKRAYEVLVFNGPTVAGQAVLSRAINDALEDQTLSTIDWHYTDSDLLRAIRENSKKGKNRLDRDFFGALPIMTMLAHVTDVDHPIFGMARQDICETIERFLIEKFAETRPYGYMLRDRGTFQKKITAVDPFTGSAWEVGERSNSLVLYGFGAKHLRLNPEEVGAEFLAWHRLQNS